MLISELTKNTDCRIIGSDCDISRIEYDSRKLTGGELFCCIRGTFKDGHEFAESAVARGAAALLVERELPLSVPQIIVKNSRPNLQLSFTVIRFTESLSSASPARTEKRQQHI